MQKFSTRAREKLWNRCAAEGQDGLPICPHCELPVFETAAWNECHVGTPKCLGGTETRVGHQRCNQLDNNQVVTPLAAKVKRVRQKNIGAHLSRHKPLPGSRRSDFKIKIGGGRAPRLTLAQRAKLMRQNREIR